MCQRREYQLDYPSNEEAESIIEDAERFLERIKKAIEENLG